MLMLLPESAGDLVCLKGLGKLTDEDLKDMMPRLEAVIAAHSRLRLLADLTEFDGWDWRAAWDDVAFGIKHWDKVTKIALIGDPSWENLVAKIADKFSPVDVRSFSTVEAGNALDWIKAG